MGATPRSPERQGWKNPPVLITKLDYEQTLSELQAFVGEMVVVSAQDADTNFMGLTFVGRLHSAPTMDLGALDPGHSLGLRGRVAALRDRRTRSRHCRRVLNLARGV
jgi:hypothetical protein